MSVKEEMVEVGGLSAGGVSFSSWFRHALIYMG